MTEATIRELREAVGLSQAALAEAVGTSQQTVDRIERGEVSHSRYTSPIRAYLSALWQGQRTGHQLRQAERYLEDDFSRRVVPSFVLSAQGQLSGGTNVEGPLGLGNRPGTYAVHLQRSVVGPKGDVLFRYGDVLFVDPTAAVRHLDPVLIQGVGGDSFQAEIRIAVDLAEAVGGPSEADLREAGYAIIGRESISRIAAVYFRYAETG